jgi:hypothetical protein
MKSNTYKFARQSEFPIFLYVCLSPLSQPAADKKPDFELFEHSVYNGRQRLGRYVRTRQGDMRPMTLAIAWATSRSARTLGLVLMAVVFAGDLGRTKKNRNRSGKSPNILDLSDGERPKCRARWLEPLPGPTSSIK